MKDTDRTYRSGPRAIADFTGRLTKKMFGQHGFVAASIITDWSAIVDPPFARESMPLKIVFPKNERQNGVLHVRVTSGSLALEMQHLEPSIIQRINTCFGYLAVKKLVISQGVIPRSPPAKIPEMLVLDEAGEKSLSDCCNVVDNHELRASLQSLGRRIFNQQKKM